MEDRCVPALVWTAPGGGEWGDAGNWTDSASGAHRIPNQSDDISLPNGRDYTVSVGTCHSLSVGSSSTFTINGFLGVTAAASFGGTVALNGSTLNVSAGPASFGDTLTLAGTSARLTVSAGDFSVTGTLTVDGGSLMLNATGHHTIGDEFFWTGGTFSGGSGAFPIELTHPVHLSGPSLKQLSGHVTNHDAITHMGTGSLLLSNNFTRVRNVGVYDVAGDASVDAHSSGNGFVNEGTLRKSAGSGVSRVLGLINYHGVVDVDAGQLDLLLQLGVSTDLMIDVAQGATASFHSDAAGALQGTLTASGTGQVLLDGSLQIGSAGATFDVPAGQLDWTSGTITAATATLTNLGDLTLSGAAGKMISGTLVNHGTIHHGGTGTLTVSGTLENHATYALTSDAWISATSGTFVNYGQVAKTAGSGPSQILGRFRNYGGHLDLASGNVALPPDTVMDDGHFHVDAGAALDLQGTCTGTFTGSGLGAVRLVRGVMTAGVGGAVLDLPSGMLRLVSGILDGGTSGFTIGAGGLTVESAPNNQVALQGLIINAGHVDHLPSGGVTMVTGTFQNWNAYVLNPGAGLTMFVFGTFVNEPGATFLKPAGAATATVSGGVSNAGGTITVEAGNLNASGSWTNAGTVNIEAGATLTMSLGYVQTAGSTTIDGAFTAQSVTILGGTLGGNGTVSGAGGVVLDGGTMAPGASPGLLTIHGPYRQTAAGSLAVELNGPTPGTEYDRLHVNGTVRLDGTLAGSCSFTPALGSTFLIIDNHAIDAVTGTFAGMPEGSDVMLGSTQFRISYAGGSGNDVTLTAVGFANAPPTAHAGGPYLIAEGDALVLNASASSDPDGDALTYSWDVDGDGRFGDAAGVAPLLGWAAMQALGIADGPSSWLVSVQVSDGIHPPVTSSAVPLTVNDTAPTIALGGDAGAVEGLPFTLTLGSVTDAGQDTIALYVVDWGDNSSSSSTASGDVTHTYADDAPARTVVVFLIDEDGTHLAGSRTIQVANSTPVAAVAGPADAVRGQLRSFTFTATDAAADAAAGFLYAVDWGDGTPVETIAATAGNGAGVSLDHAYVAEGVYTVRVTATDKDGGVSPEATLTLNVSRVAVQDDPLHPGQSMLVVGGTPGADRIALAAGPNPGDVRVRFDRVVEGPFHVSSPTSRVIVYGYDGDDEVYVNRQLTLPAWLVGGAGDDQLTGGNGPNVLLGGEDDDLLVGRNSRDLLIGGLGADELRGGPSEDLLIAGFTAFDQDEAALAAIQDEWLSSHRYDDRLDNLTGVANSTFGSRLNQNYFLQAGGPQATVFDDSAADVLRGGQAIDAFFARLNSGVVDVVRPLQRRERVFEI